MSDTSDDMEAGSALYDNYINKQNKKMSEQKESILVDGLFFKKPIETAPDFVKGHVSIKADELIAFLTKHKKADGWVNVDLLKSKDGTKLYFKLNTWEPKKDESALPEVKESDVPW